MELYKYFATAHTDVLLLTSINAEEVQFFVHQAIFWSKLSDQHGEKLHKYMFHKFQSSSVIVRSAEWYWRSYAEEKSCICSSI